MRRFIALAFAVLAAASPAGQSATGGQPTPAGQPAAAGQQAAALQAEEAAVIEQSRTTIRFENDGTGRRETYVRVRAQSEAGVQQWGQVVLGYNAATERLEISFVRVRKADGSVVGTPSQSVQDLSSPVQGIAPVYTDFRQKHVTVQSFRPGDTLEVSVVTTIHTAPAPGHFWTEYTFNDETIVLDEQLDVDVPASRPLILKVGKGFDPVVKDADGRRMYHWSHAHAVRASEKTGPSPAPGEANPSDEPVRAPVRLTTFADWKEIGGWFAGLERTARKSSPEISDKARQLTAGRTTDLEKVEALYDFVSKNFRYVSLSLGAGRYQPRDAAAVLRDAYGDCKDKHTLLAALLEVVGLQASAVLINSGTKIDPDFPSPSQFNHVITLAHAAGQDVWLDSTPEVAPFRLLSYGLRAKQALVADPGRGSLQTTPTNPPMPALMRTEVKGALSESGTLTADVNITARGDVELLLRTAFRATPRAQWSDAVQALARDGGLDGKVSAVNISDPQATREPFSIGFHVEAERYSTVAGRKSDLTLPLAGEEALAAIEEAGESGPIELGAPGDTTYVLSLAVPAAARLRAAVPVSISRDYAEYRSAYAATGGTLHVERVLTLKQRDVPQARRGDYLAFRRAMASDVSQRVSLDGTAIAAPAVAGDAKAYDLNLAGYEALQAGEYSKAIDLLTRALTADPKVPKARIYLAQAQLSLKQPEAALATLRAQAEINPYEEYVYFYTGRAHVALRQYPAAEQAYNKQLEINPLDKYAPGALGAMYMEQRQYDKAAKAYEKSAAVNPEQAYAQTQLGKAYLNLRRTDEAMAAFSKAVELAPNAGTWNSVAYELALAGVDLARAQRYAESAIASQAAASRNLDVDHADARALGIAGSLAAYWDTLGWIHFTNGDLGRAEKYVAAAWSIAQHAEVGDHLGQIYEKTSRKNAAIDAYAQALSAPNPDPMVREHLVRVTGDAPGAGGLIDRQRVDLASARTVPLPGKGPAGKKADFLVLFASPGPVEAVKFVEGDTEMRSVGLVLKQLKPFTFPGDPPAKLLRRGTASCNGAGACTFMLLLPEDARPVK